MPFIDEQTQQFFADLHQRMSQAEEAAARRREQSEKSNRIRDVGRMMASLSNLYFATHGAPHQSVGQPTKPVKAEEEAEEARLARQRERLLKAHESITRLRMAGAKADADIAFKASRQQDAARRTDADIAYKNNRQQNDNRRTDADIEKKAAEKEVLQARGAAAQGQAEVKSAEAAIKRQEASYLPEKQRQEAAVRQARAQQVRAATQQRRLTLKDVRNRQKKFP